MSEDDKLLKDAKKLPWEDRLLHKNWKVRNDANIDLAALFDSITDPKDPRICEFGGCQKSVEDGLQEYSLIWATECFKHWRMLRSLCRTKLFKAEVLESQSSIKERNIKAMVEFLKENKGALQMFNFCECIRHMR